MQASEGRALWSHSFSVALSCNHSIARQTKQLHCSSRAEVWHCACSCIHHAAAIEAGARTNCHSHCCAHVALELVAVLFCAAFRVPFTTVVVPVAIAVISSKSHIPACLLCVTSHFQREFSGSDCLADHVRVVECRGRVSSANYEDRPEDKLSHSSLSSQFLS